MPSDPHIPPEATDALRVLRSVLDSVVAAWLFGSAVTGGLRPRSDVDVLAVIDRPIPDEDRHRLARDLMQVSGRIGNREGRRPLELTVLRASDVVPWRYPPRAQFVYGEWLRDDFASGRIPAPGTDPDLAIVLWQARERSIPLLGPDASALLDPVPVPDVRRAMRDALPALVAGLPADERNVLLTLARMWHTAVEGGFVPKDLAAEWAVARLHEEEAALLELARRGYIGDCEDHWQAKEAGVASLVGVLEDAVRSSLGGQGS